MKESKGFTIIELLVMISVFVVVSLVAFSFLSMTLLSTSKAMATKEVRQNGNYAMSIIERLVISAKSVPIADCTTQSIKIITLDNESTTIGCTADKRIASGSAYLTNNKVSVFPCSFTCTSGEGVPSSVDVSFTVGIGDVGSPAHEKSSMTFQNKFIVRNQRD